MIATYSKGGSVEIPVFALIAAELWYLCFVAWFWSLGSFLSSVVRPDLRLNLKFFYLALMYPPVYIAFFQVAFDKLTSPYIFLAVFPFHLFAMYCMFFNLNFVSKSLALAEKGEPVSFSGYAGPFFLLWFFPIGIWFVQPRVNRLYAATLRQQTA